MCIRREYGDQFQCKINTLESKVEATSPPYRVLGVDFQCEAPLVIPDRSDGETENGGAGGGGGGGGGEGGGGAVQEAGQKTDSSVQRQQGCSRALADSDRHRHNCSA